MSDNEVQVKFGGETSDIDRAANEVIDKLQGILGISGDLQEKFVAVGEAFAGAFAAEKILTFAEQIGELGEQVERTSAMTGLSTKEIIDFQFAVKMTGGDAESAGMSLIRLERNIEQAANGSKIAKQAFADAGVSVKTLASRDVNSILGEMADKFASTADGAGKVAVAMELAGRGGASLIPILDKGRSGLADISATADRVNSSLEQNASKFAQTGQAIKVAQTSTSNFTQTLYSAFEPALNAVVVTFGAWMDELTKSAQGGNVLTAVVTMLGDALWAIIAAVDAVITGFEQLWDIGKGVFLGLMDGAEGLGEALQDIGSGQFSKAASDVGNAGKKMGDDIASGFNKASDAGAQFVQRTKSAWAALNGGSVGLGGENGGGNKPQLQSHAGEPEDNKKPQTDEAAQRQVLEEKYNVQKEYDALEVQNGAMTNEEKYADLKDALDKEIAAIDQSFERQKALYDSDSADYKRLCDEKEVADQKYTIEKMKLDQEAAKNGEKVYTDATHIMESSLDQMLKGVLQGTQTISQAFARMAGNMIMSFAEAIAEILVENGLLWVAQQLGFTKMSGSLSSTLGEWNLTEAQKTAATTAANTARGFSDSAAATVSVATVEAATKSEIEAYAAVAAAASFASVAAIPVVGWAMAPEVGDAALGQVMAYETFDVGTPNVPRDMLAQIHEGEAIIPKHTAQAWRDGDTQALGGGGGSNPVHFHISSMDSAGVAKLLKQHGSAIAAGVASAARGGNGGLRTALGRM